MFILDMNVGRKFKEGAMEWRTNDMDRKIHK